MEKVSPLIQGPPGPRVSMNGIRWTKDRMHRHIGTWTWNLPENLSPFIVLMKKLIIIIKRGIPGGSNFLIDSWSEARSSLWLDTPLFTNLPRLAKKFIANPFTYADGTKYKRDVRSNELAYILQLIDSVMHFSVESLKKEKNFVALLITDRIL